MPGTSSRPTEHLVLTARAGGGLLVHQFHGDTGRTRGFHLMSHRLTIIVSTLLLALGPGLAAAQAGSDYRSFNATIYGNQRLPADTSGKSDRAYPAVNKKGTVLWDAPGSSCRNKFTWQLVRNISFSPDDPIYDGGATFCASRSSAVSLTWPSSRYHWDARVTLRPDPASGSGFVEARWP